MFDFSSSGSDLWQQTLASLSRTRAHTHTLNIKPMISTQNLGTHPNIGHQSKTDWQRAILICSNARSPQGEPLPNPIHYCPLYPLHLLASLSLSLSLPCHCTHHHPCDSHVLSVNMMREHKTAPGGQLSRHVFVPFNEAPAHLQMLASVASAPVWRFNFRGAARWWTRGLPR